MLERILMTGAAGGVGQLLRPLLQPMAAEIRLADIAPISDLRDGEEYVELDVADADAVNAAVQGCDAIIHLAGVSVEKAWSKIRPANIDGVYNLYEAARANGKPRIVFASSNHVIGFHTQETYLDDTAAPRPDGLYGVSKCFGEAMASMYHDKFGIETAIVRIGSCFPEPANLRMLSTWLSAADFARLIERCLTVPRLGCPIIYGVSANDSVWWDNSSVSYLGWKPRDNSEIFRDKVAASGERPGPEDPAAKYQGGLFTQDPIYKA